MKSARKLVTTIALVVGLASAFSMLSATAATALNAPPGQGISGALQCQNASIEHWTNTVWAPATVAESGPAMFLPARYAGEVGYWRAELLAVVNGRWVHVTDGPWMYRRLDRQIRMGWWDPDGYVFNVASYNTYMVQTDLY